MAHLSMCAHLIACTGVCILLSLVKQQLRRPVSYEQDRDKW